MKALSEVYLEAVVGGMYVILIDEEPQQLTLHFELKPIEAEQGVIILSGYHAPRD